MPPDVRLQVDFSRIRRNILAIRAQARVDVIAVIKANAYGIGGRAVAEAVVDLVDAFYVFHVDEAVAYGLPNLSTKPTLAIHAGSLDGAELRRQHIRPVVWTTEQARTWQHADPVVSIDTGQQRFAASIETAESIIAHHPIHEVMTHASSLDQAQTFAAQLKRLSTRPLRAHAAGSALLGFPEAAFDAVRPGLAMYDEAVTISTPLVEVRDSTGPAGYSGFHVPRFGVILMGYSQGLRTGPCMVNGNRSRILEVGMQTAFVEVTRDTRAGDEVALLGAGLPVTEIAKVWKTSPHEVLVCLTKDVQSRADYPR